MAYIKNPPFSIHKAKGDFVVHLNLFWLVILVNIYEIFFEQGCGF